MERLPEVEKAMIDYFTQHASDAAEGIQVLPGVPELLRKLKVGRGLEWRRSALSCFSFLSLQNSIISHCAPLVAGAWLCTHLPGDRQPGAHRLEQDAGTRGEKRHTHVLQGLVARELHHTLFGLLNLSAPWRLLLTSGSGSVHRAQLWWLWQ